MLHGWAETFKEGRCKTICCITYSVILTNSPPPTDKSFGYTVESVAQCLFASHKHQATQKQRYLSKRVYRFSVGSTIVLNFYGHKSAYNSVTNEYWAVKVARWWNWVKLNSIRLQHGRLQLDLCWGTKVTWAKKSQAVILWQQSLHIIVFFSWIVVNCQALLVTRPLAGLTRTKNTAAESCALRK